MSSGIPFPFVIPGCAILAQARNPYPLRCRLVLNETQGLDFGLALRAPRNDELVFFGCLKFESELRMPQAYNGAALSLLRLDSFEANEASMMTTAIRPITIVQIALISGFTPSRTSE